MAVNKDPSLAYKDIKLYTDYNLDYYESLLGKDIRDVPHSTSSKIMKDSNNLLESVLKKNIASKSDSNSLDSVDCTVSLKNVKKNFPYLQYKPCVSFDTVPISSPSKDTLIEKEYPSYDFPGVQIPPELYTMDEWYDTESGYAANDNSEYFIHNNYLTSDSSFDFLNSGNDNNNDIDNNISNNSNNNSNPSSSAYRKRASSPTRIKSHNTLRQMQNTFKLSIGGKIVREDYPSRPTVDNDAMVINRAYGRWNVLWNKRRLQIDDRLLNKTVFFKYSNILFPDLNKDKKKLDDDQVNLSNGSDKEWELMTRKEKKRWLIMNEVVGYPTGPKTILCHISGRKHTWVGLDYTIMKLAQDTDHVVIVANLNKLRKCAHSNYRYISSNSFDRRRNHCQHRHTATTTASTTNRSRHHKRQASYTLALSDLSIRSKSISRDENITTVSSTASDGDDKIGIKLTKTKSMDPDLVSYKSYISDNDSNYDEDEDEDDGVDPQWAYGYDRQSISDKLKDILLYISVLLSKHPTSIKVTVEIVIGKSVNILNEMVNVYMPDLFVMAKKKVTSEIRWHSVHLTDKFLKHSPVPICVVFVKPMCQFEIDLANQFSNDSNTITETETIVDVDERKKDKPVSIKAKHSLEQLDKWIISSIESGSKMARPQAQPKMMKSMIEIALANNKAKSSHRKTRSNSSHDMLTRNTKLRTPTESPLRRELVRSDKINSSSTLGVPLSKTRTISTAKPVKNWSTDKNSLRKIKSSTPDDVPRSQHYSNGNSSSSGGSGGGGGGGFFSSLFKRRW
ncbi:hypothetical protein RI543_004121 [Arxiozyma heterogenica]|uniref:Uncharacterized protein n=1 Tax=Arxiozyma heterogenica TaxID=278026 RepID=A0AAN7ZX85_9SACH|nr:hypothetical protein RI543_004121 [Kazachstania heterogenica]